jgi:hypothetical protein
LAIRGAAMLAAQGINQFAAAAQMIEKGTGQPVRYRFDADGRPVYSYGEAASAPAPISPPLGPQSTLQGMSAAGQVPSDMVNPTWPTIYPTPYS